MNQLLTDHSASRAAQLRNNLLRNCLGDAFSRKKNRLVAEYALRGLDQSIAVAAWQTQLTESLPEELRGSLPTIEEIGRAGWRPSTRIARTTRIS